MRVQERRSRFYVPIVVFVSGLLLAAAAFAGGTVGAAQGITLAAVVGALVVYGLGGRENDVGAVLASDRDERQALLDMRARAVTLIVVFVVCGVLAAHEFLQGGRAQPYFDLCLFTVVTYVGSLLWLKRRDSAPSRPRSQSTRRRVTAPGDLGFSRTELPDRSGALRSTQT